MKALFISYNGALEPLIQSQGIPYLKGLSDKGIKCSLLSFEKKIEGAVRLKKELNEYGIEWYYLRYHKSPTLPATLFDIITGTLSGLFIVIFKNINIIHARGTVSAVIGYIIARLTGKKFIFDVRGLMAEEYVDGGVWKRNSFLYKVTLYMEKILLHRADKAIVLTQNIRDFLINSNYLQKHYIKKNNITVIPCCVDIKKFNTEESVLTEKLREKYGLFGKFVFLYIGSVGTWYLLDEMIDFFITAKSLINNAHFLILTYIDKNMVMSSCEKKGLSFSDITVDEAEFCNMPHYIKLADAGLFFIKSCFSKRFSCPTKLAEYLACGLPVVINSGVGDTGEFVSYNRIGVVIRDFYKKEYFDKAGELLKLIGEDKELSNRCRLSAENYLSLNMGIELYQDVYRELVK